MGRFLRLILVSTALVAFSSFDVTVDEILGAMKKGDAFKMSRHFDNLVEITLHERSNSYSRGQAEMVLNDFFSSTGIKNFEVQHKGQNNESEFCVGNLTTRNGAFRTIIIMKMKGDKKLLQQIKFEDPVY